MYTECRNRGRIAGTKDITLNCGIGESRSNSSIDRCKVTAAIKIIFNSTVRQSVGYITSNGDTKLHPINKTTLSDFISHTIRLIKYLKFIFGVVTFVVGSIVFNFKRIETIPVKTLVGPCSNVG